MPLLPAGEPAEQAADLRRRFTETYGREADAVGRAPGRVNLIGEHTDYNGGLCLPVALPHGTLAAVAVRDDDVVRLTSAQTDVRWEGRLAHLGPGDADGWAAYAAGVLWALREDGHDLPGLDLLVDGTVPLGAGLSSSAALECAVAVAAGAVTSSLGESLTDEQVGAVVAACMRAETEVAGAPTGGMDQSIAMRAEADHALLLSFDPAADREGRAGGVGGIGSSEHGTEERGGERSRDTQSAEQNGGAGWRHVPLALGDHVLLVTDTRVSHALGDGGYGSRREQCEAAAAELGVASLAEATPDAVDSLADELLRRRARHVVSEVERVRRAVTALEAGDLEAVGRIFAASHASMRDDFEISCAELDTAVGVAVEAGAAGARMTGGGFGGSSVALVPAARQEAVMTAIDTAFVAAGFRAPQHLLAPPSAGAVLV